jgi:hypothetical protein
VYDMYPWHDRPADATAKPDPATNAVQTALDRRDNGGGATATGTPTASMNTTGPTRQ